MEIMKPFSKRIDDLDDHIVDLLFRAARADSKGMNPDIIQKIYADLIKFSCNLEEELMADMAAKDRKTA